jgi:outer membrane immunogenic protein
MTEKGVEYMLRESSGARLVAPRQGGGRFGPIKSFTAVSLLALVGAAAVAPAQAADKGGKVSNNQYDQNEDEFGFRGPAVFDWSGIYVGGHFGGAWGDVDWSGPAVSQFVDEGRISHEVEGSLTGGHLGFNHQFGRWVGGVEVSLSGGDVEGSSVAELNFQLGDVATKTEIDSLFLATVRLGYAWNRSLVYLKGGYASADVKLRGTGEEALDDVDFTSSERHAGFALGGGFEYAFTDRVTFGLEYNRVDLGSATHVGFVSFDNEIVDAVPVRVEPDVLHVAMARLSLKFGDEAAALPAMLK